MGEEIKRLEELKENTSDFGEQMEIADKIHNIKMKLKDDIRRLYKNFNPEAFSETTPDAKYTSYSVNKGEKIVFCLEGRILDVFVDLRAQSKTYKLHDSKLLEADIPNSILIPKGFAHGFIVLSNLARVSYKVDNYYNPNSEEGLNYNDPKLDIDWKINKKDIIINEKDLSYSDFNSIDFI